MSLVAVLAMFLACVLLKHAHERRPRHVNDRRSAYFRLVGGLLMALTFIASWQHDSPSLALLHWFAIGSPIAMALALMRAWQNTKK